MLGRILRPFQRGTRAAELAVLRELLPGPDERHSLLVAQFERARAIRRERPSSHAYRAGPASTTDDLRFPLELGRIASAWTSYTTERGVEVRFRVVVTRGGFLEWLEGETADSSEWPDDWAPARRSSSASTLMLPSLDIQHAIAAKGRRRLARWLGLTQSQLSRVTIRPPATAARIREAERTGGFHVPPDLDRFLRISDGIEVGWVRLFGCDELYLLDDVPIAAIVVSWDADAEDDVAVIVDPSGLDPAVYGIRIHDEIPVRRPLAPTYCEYLRLVLAG